MEKIITDDDTPKLIKIESIRDYCFARDNIKKLQEARDRKNDPSYLQYSQRHKEIDYFDELIKQQQIIIDDYVAKQPTMSAKYFGSNVKYLLKLHNLHVADLETILGISAGYISRTLVDSSKKRLSIDVMWQISNLFSINIDTLINVNLCDVPVSIKPVMDFMEKLMTETELSNLKWKNRGSVFVDKLSILYKEDFDFMGNKIYVYSPNLYEEETIELSVNGDIYEAESNGDMFYVIPVREESINATGIEIYVLEVYEDYEAFHRICCTLDDRTGNLTAKANELINMIKLHENDFVITQSAKNYITNYLNMDSGK